MGEAERIPVAANVLGTIGTVFWCIQLVPQIWHNWKNKKTDGLPPSMMFLWGACMYFFGPFLGALLDLQWNPPYVCFGSKGVSIADAEHIGAVPFGVYMVLQVRNKNDPGGMF